MDRRTFLVGMGKFAGGALVIPQLPSIFDMGRTCRLVLPGDAEFNTYIHRGPYLPRPLAGDHLRELVLPTVLSRFMLKEHERGRLLYGRSSLNLANYGVPRSAT